MTPPGLDSDPSIAWGSVAIWGGILVWALAGAWLVRRRRLWRLDLESGSPADLTDDATLAPLLLASGFSIWFAQLIGVQVSASLADVDTTGNPTLGATAIILGGGLAGGGVAIAALLSFNRTLRSVFLPRGPIRPQLARGAGGFAIVYPWVLIISGLATMLETMRARAAGEAEPGAIAHATLALLTDEGSMFGFSWWAIVVMVILGTAALEEVIFRGGLQGSLERALTSSRQGDDRSLSSMRWAAIAITSLIFAGVHFSATPWYGLVSLFVLSLGFGAAYARTKSIVVPVVMHGLFNAVNVGLAVLGV